MPPLGIGENWIWEVGGEINGPYNNSGGGTAVTVTAETQLILRVFRWYWKWYKVKERSFELIN